MSGRLIAIGDVHGCNLALIALLGQMKLDTNDVVVTLGDYIDRGPDSQGVLDTLIELRKHCHLIPILGNHEEMLLDAREDPSKRVTWLVYGGEEALISYHPRATFSDIPDRHWAFLESCQSLYETDSFAFLHAGYRSDVAFHATDGYALRWRSLPEALPLERHCSGKTAVVGHTPCRSGQILDLGHLIDIDTNCCRGGWLTGLNVENMHYWQSRETGETRSGQLRE